MNWKNGIEQLMSHRTAVEIAAESGLSVSSVYDLKNGYTKEPRGMAAVILHAMIAEVRNGDDAPIALEASSK